MIRLLLFRLLPGAAAATLLTSALSPLMPALQAFGAAAEALAGESSVDSSDIGAPTFDDPRGGAGAVHSNLPFQKSSEGLDVKQRKLKAIAGQFADQPEVPVFGQEPLKPKRKR